MVVRAREIEIGSTTSSISPSISKTTADRDLVITETILFCMNRRSSSIFNTSEGKELIQINQAPILAIATVLFWVAISETQKV